MTICENTSDNLLDAYLPTYDSTSGNLLTYSVKAAPSHGTIQGFPAYGSSDGGVFSPSGNFYYSPSAGYSGTDAFEIEVTDGSVTATTTIKVTVNATPTVASITGTAYTCGTGSSTLADATSGGTWSSSNTFSSTINATTGVVTGQSAGESVISYTVTNSNGCTGVATTTFIVSGYPSVSTITGNNTICVNATTTFSDAAAGGTWTSGNTNIAKVDSSTGVVTGIGTGTATINYSITNAYGCSSSANRNIVVDASPVVNTITATKTGVCVGATLTLTDATRGGVWSSSNTNIATVSTTGTVTGVTAGTDTIYYTVTNNITGCTASSSVQITVSAVPVVAAITGSTAACVGDSSQLLDATTGGTWASSNSAVAKVSSTGYVTGVAAGTATITYTVTNAGGCSSFVYVTVTVSSSPTVAAVTGNASLCVNSTTTLTDVTSGGIWTSSNANATVNASGVVTGVSLGKDTISYTVTNAGGCSTSATYVVTVSSAIIVPTIKGTSTICNGTTTTLTDSASGGVWSSSDATIATVSSAGVVTSVNAGAAVISYTLGSGSCVGSATADVIVHPTPTVAANSVSSITICYSDGYLSNNSKHRNYIHCYKCLWLLCFVSNKCYFKCKTCGFYNFWYQCYLYRNFYFIHHHWYRWGLDNK